jgi:nucleoside recognition membrane protein YjiH
LNLKLFLKFLLPSIIGVLFFLFPVSYGGNETILLAVITNIVRAPFEDYMLEIIVSVVLISAIGSGYYVAFKPDWKSSYPSLYIICHTTPLWFAIRTVGAIFGIMVYFQLGPQIIWGQDTGLTVFTEIGATIFFIVTVACFLMSFLTEFGFMEFIGTLLSKPFGLLFTLPGRSAIDAMASFLTASNVGLLITISQYEKGYYTARQAAAVAVNFSVVSVSFSLLIATVSGIEHMFFNWYLSVVFACMLCAVITVRLPPLSNLKDTYYPPVGKQISERQSKYSNPFRASIENAMVRAKTSPGPKKFIINGWYGAIGVVFGVLGPSMAIGTTTIILLTHTPIFDILSYPIFSFLELIQFPDAKAAAPGMIIGFLDQFMPALVASNIENELVKFVLAGLGVTQLIYMSEVGLIIIRSSLPLNFGHLVIIFILRTVISFPVLLIAGLILL